MIFPHFYDEEKLDSIVFYILIGLRRHVGGLFLDHSVDWFSFEQTWE